eukprot:XP_002267628.3 PREDICTED: cytochrome P450 89A2 [Vitis vinifera]
MNFQCSTMNPEERIKNLMTKMETWLFIIISLCVAAFLKSLYDFFFPKLNLPPGPTRVPLIGNFLLFRKSLVDFEPVIRNLHSKYGPILTVHFGSRPVIFVSSDSLSHQALVQKGAVFADRTEALPISKIFSSNKHTISTAFYGPTWRVLRRNLTTEILHPSWVRSYAHARKWVLGILLSRVTGHSGPVRVVDHFRYAMFYLLVLMCFGDKLKENQIREIETIQRRLLLRFRRVNILSFWPRLRMLLFRKHWEEALQLRKDQEGIILPHTRARQQLKQQLRSKEQEDDSDPGSSSSSTEYVLSYVDTLLDLQLPEEENRKLSEGEMVSLCSEFLNGGTETTSTTLQWIMANLVKHPHIQAKLFEEISGVVGEGGEEVKREDLQKMPYLKAVILEGLRRHPPAHFLLPHSVTQDTTLEGFAIPKNTLVNFMVADMGWNPKIWDDPMAFKPERFMNSKGNGVEAFDVTGRKEIRMIPFGAGRRICPGYELAILHLEYFVANLVLNFEWRAVDGDEVDLSEEQGFTVEMKNPLQVHLSPRRK